VHDNLKAKEINLLILRKNILRIFAEILDIAKGKRDTHI
jgi:hypothetical protein